MKSLRWGAIVFVAAVGTGALTTACRSTFVVVQPPEGGYTAADTLRGHLRGDEVRVTFRFDTIMRVDTVTRVDTLFLEGTDTVIRLERLIQVDTLLRTDTLRLTVTDTVLRTDTVSVPGRRLLFIPPGHYPPEGQCRVWIHGLPPGQQANAAGCDALGQVPAGAFVLFGGDAWDFDYDWIAEARRHPGTVPPEIIALKRSPARPPPRP